MDRGNMEKEVSRHLCGTCGREFATKCNMLAHQILHTDSMPFVCGTCSRKFRQKSHLIQHQSLHGAINPYPCTICNKTFTSPSKLQRHKSSHSRIFTHECPLCPRKYLHPENVVRHINRVHINGPPTRTLHCHQCNITFPTFVGLNNHRRSRRHVPLPVHPVILPLPAIAMEKCECCSDTGTEDLQRIYPGQSLCLPYVGMLLL